MPEARLRLRDTELGWRDVEGEVLALDLARSRYLAVNRAGRVIWMALREGATEDELVESVVEEFGVARERASADVGGFLAELDAQGLIVRDDAAPGRA